MPNSMSGRTALAVLALASTAACADGGSQPTSLDAEALVASAPAWQPTDITAGLPVDAATRARIDADLTALHASLLEIHGRYEAALARDGATRATALAAVERDLQALHAEHAPLWNALDPQVRDSLAARIHTQMDTHMGAHDGEARSIHDRMRRLHGGTHDGPAGH